MTRPARALGDVGGLAFVAADRRWPLAGHAGALPTGVELSLRTGVDEAAADALARLEELTAEELAEVLRQVLRLED